MRIRYTPYEVEPIAGGASVLYRPVIRAQLAGPRARGTFWALLDTGSDETYITQEMADFLGVQTEQTTRTAESASGLLNVRYGEIGVELSAETEFYGWRAAVGVVDAPWPEAIFGHQGVLEFFDATFFGADKIAELTANRSLIDGIRR